jgi:hypothetical protein
LSRRKQIEMSAAEAAAFLAQERTVVCATIGPRGWPHLMPLWYVLRTPHADEPDTRATGALAPDAREPDAEEPGPQLWSWTYAVSQKVRNLERDARATLQVEAGEEYQELRGVMLECEVHIHRDLETVKTLGHEIFARYATPRGEPAVELPAEVGAVVDQQAAKRVALQFVELRRASWDHRKLAGVY